MTPLRVRNIDGVYLGLWTVRDNVRVATLEPSGEPNEWKLFQDFYMETTPRVTFLWKVNPQNVVERAVEFMNHDTPGFNFELVEKDT